MNTNKGFAPIIAIIVAVVIIAGGIGGYLYIKNKNNLLIVTPSNVSTSTGQNISTSAVDNSSLSDQEYRDSKRASDLDSISSAISLWITDTDAKFNCVKGKIYDSRKGTTAVDGTGWIPVNLNTISGGSPLSEFNKDPLNNSQYYYSFACDPKAITFELTAKIESSGWKEIYGNKDLMIFGTQKNLIP